MPVWRLSNSHAYLLQQFDLQGGSRWCQLIMGATIALFQRNPFRLTTTMDVEPLSPPRKLGDTDSVLPRLIGLMDTLSDSAGSALDAALIEAPTYELPRRFHRLLELVAEIAGSITNAGTIDREAVLQDVERLMHAISSFAEYLGSILRALGEHHGQQKHTKAAAQKIGQLINQQFKVPINKIKHDGFTLGWLSITHDDQPPVHGFAVNGLIKPRTFGPASFRFPSAIAEGYSFSLFLRRATETPYELCDLVESAVRHLYRNELHHKETLPSRSGSKILAEVVSRQLSYMPFTGFPNEHMARVPELGVAGGSLLVLRTRMLRFPKGAYTVSSHLRARQGYTFKLPYWVK